MPTDNRQPDTLNLIGSLNPHYIQGAVNVYLSTEKVPERKKKSVKFSLSRASQIANKIIITACSCQGCWEKDVKIF